MSTNLPKVVCGFFSLKNFDHKSWTKPLATYLSTWSLEIADLETVHDKAYSDDDK